MGPRSEVGKVKCYRVEAKDDVRVDLLDEVLPALEQVFFFIKAPYLRAGYGRTVKQGEDVACKKRSFSQRLDNVCDLNDRVPFRPRKAETRNTALDVVAEDSQWSQFLVG